jgi:hypothetical protein
MDDPSIYSDIDLNLWLEAGSSSGLDKNRVYELSNTTTKNLWTNHSVLIAGCSQSVMSLYFRFIIFEHTNV